MSLWRLLAGAALAFAGVLVVEGLLAGGVDQGLAAVPIGDVLPRVTVAVLPAPEVGLGPRPVLLPAWGYGLRRLRRSRTWG